MEAEFSDLFPTVQDIQLARSRRERDIRRISDYDPNVQPAKAGREAAPNTSRVLDQSFSLITPAFTAISCMAVASAPGISIKNGDCGHPA